MKKAFEINDKIIGSEIFAVKYIDTTIYIKDSITITGTITNITDTYIQVDGIWYPMIDRIGGLVNIEKLEQ